MVLPPPGWDSVDPTMARTGGWQGYEMVQNGRVVMGKGSYQVTVRLECSEFIFLAKTVQIGPYKCNCCIRKHSSIVVQKRRAPAVPLSRPVP